MREDVKRKWVDALRSGKFTQGTGRLNDGGRYCCLGVLCELAVREGVANRRWDEDEDAVEYGLFDADDDDDVSTGMLPRPVIEWAGLESHNPTVPFHLVEGYVGPESGERHGLSMVNDFGHSFETIADVIETHL